MKRRKIIIAGSIFGFPNGQGATARISQYADGLVGNGFDVTVLCLKATDSRTAKVANEVSGKYRGASYFYTCGSSIFSTSKLGRYLQNIAGIVGAVRIVNRLKRQGGVSAMLMYGTDSPIYTVILWLLARYCKAVFVGENTEAPFVYCSNTLLTRLNRLICNSISYKTFDGFVVISTYLEALYGNLLPRGVPILKVPVLVNTKDFQVGQLQAKENCYVVYCGNLTNRGELESVLDIWSQVKLEAKDAKLLIIGNNSDRVRMLEVESYISKLGLAGTVEFTGLVSRDRLISFLMMGSVMVLPRAAGVFSAAGLPNKLGEYLATGHPTITSKNGDIDLYLEHGKTAYLSEPGDLTAFVDNLKYVLKNIDEARVVGLRGRQVAIDCFDTQLNSVILGNFVLGLAPK